MEGKDCLIIWPRGVYECVIFVYVEVYFMARNTIFSDSEDSDSLL